MPITWALVVSDYAPELSSVDDAVGARKVLEAASQMNQGAWGTLYDSAHANLTAHLAALQALKGGAGKSGPVTAESVGQMSRSYAGLPQHPYLMPGLSSTRWGLEFIRLMTWANVGMQVV